MGNRQYFEDNVILMQVAQLRMDPERPLEKSSGLFVVVSVEQAEMGTALR